MSTLIRWIVFDLGGVVINVDFENFFRTLPISCHGAASLNRDSLIAMFREYEARSGEQLPGQVFDSIRSALGIPVSDQELTHAVNQMLGNTIQPVCEAISTLSRSYQVACLSNTNHIHWDYLQAEYQVMNKFTVQMASHLMGVAKPDAKIYRKAQTILGVKASEILFFDDKPENIDAARAQGWNASVYSGYGSFASDLQSYGIQI